MATNPILSEIDGLSPAAKQALMQAHGAVLSSATNPTQGTLPPSPQMAALRHPAAPETAPEPLAPLAKPITAKPLPDVASAQPNVIGPRGTVSGDEAERSRLATTGSGISQIHNGFLRGLARVGDTVGGLAAPGLMAAIPGTEEHHARLMGQNDRQLAADQGIAAKDAETAGKQATTQESQARIPQIAAQTREENAHADALENPGPKLESPQQGYSAAISDAITRGVDPATDPHVVAWKTAIDNIAKQQNPPKLSYETVVGPDGKPHTYGMDNTGNKAVDVGVHYEKPAVSVNANHEFAENERGRGLLDKAEGNYRTAEQSVNGIRSMIDNAKAGDKMSARMLPLEGALEITTSQGVHRINRTEVDQYAGGGSAFDRLAGMLKGASTGVPFTDEILNSMKHLADIQEKGAYENYKGAYDSATKRYHLTDEQPLRAPAQGGDQPQGSGKAVSLKEAMSLPQNKGRSADEVRQDIEAHGHKVVE